jgi:hypothetical protein
VMKPNPFSALNHFTVPVATSDPSFLRRRGLWYRPSGYRPQRPGGNCS